MQIVKNISIIVIAVLTIINSLVLVFRATTTAQVMADFGGYQRCVAEVQAQVQQVQANQAQDGNKK